MFIRKSFDFSFLGNKGGRVLDYIGGRWRVTKGRSERERKKEEERLQR